ncbi:hypothetical protein KAX75_06820 [candidate division WOR-3 bacterium]|nr:hypothetical protein [candidate division WOR-3 bacterium]
MAKILLIVLVILIIIIIIIASSIAIGNIIFNRQVKREVTEMFEKSKKIKPKVITEADIEGLPEPVQRWLKYSQVIGKERTLSVRLKQKGFFRQKKDKNWMPFKAEEYYTTDSPAFIWYTTMKATPFLSITGRDMYYEGKGNMLIKLLSLITVADAIGEEITQGTLLRYLNEIMWFPTAALSDYIEWDPIDSKSAKATMSYQDVTASAVFYFNEQGEFTNMIAERYMDIDGQFSLEKWSTPISEYGEFNGIRIPIKGEGVWHLKSGDFSYIRLEITDIEYNNPSIY